MGAIHIKNRKNIFITLNNEYGRPLLVNKLRIHIIVIIICKNNINALLALLPINIGIMLNIKTIMGKNICITIYLEKNNAIFLKMKFGTIRYETSISISIKTFNSNSFPSKI